jgi:hypothetical protein
LQIDFPARESDVGWRTVIARKCDSTEKTEFMPEGKDDEGFCARLRMRTQGDYFRRNSSEMSLETERNTSTASAPIMPKAIIIFSGRA